MRIIPFIISASLLIILIFLLDHPWGTAPGIGRFLSPQHGFWQNAEQVKQDISFDMNSPDLSGNVNVYFDQRMVPHVFADEENDAYFVQGYLHARFRLWQMEVQTYAAAGRLSEIFGENMVKFDREQRRLGMADAAETMLKEMEKNPISKAACDHYTKGVNAYIDGISESALPLEYKLLGYKPEKWTNLKIALFAKQMAKTLASAEDDILNTAARKIFTDEQMKILFPQIPDSLDPIIPRGVSFSPPSLIPVMPRSADSLYLGKRDSIPDIKIKASHKDNGSNNWAVSGARTSSGTPILSNDPHLDLSLPSIWYEMHINAPALNVYGVSFPGIPGIVIGFNDSIAWGVTDSRRDVRDYYEIRFKDESKKQYWFNKEWKEVEKIRIEEIRIKNKASIYDTVAYTVFGPVMYDDSFKDLSGSNRTYAVRWKAHDPSNELIAFMELDHSKNYRDFEKAVSKFSCPGQNFVFASSNGDIAISQQGSFPARWNRQGLYVMPGTDSSYMWQGMIPQKENPGILNPARGFVSSANQRAADSSYPYFIPGAYDLYRSISINRRLSNMYDVTPQNMMQLQNDNFNQFAQTARPLLTKYTNQLGFTANESKYFDIFSAWDLYNNPEEQGATIFTIWIDSLKAAVWDDDLATLETKELYPSEQTLIEALLKDSAFIYIDNISTPATESLGEIITNSFKNAVTTIIKLENEKKLEWVKYKNTSIYHMLGKSLAAFSRTSLNVGGGKHVINATQGTHGPSWKMVVQMGAQTEAWVIYPGGQSGNPGSFYYDNFIDDWAAGKHYKAWLMKKNEANNKNVKAAFHFKKGIP